MSGLFFAGDRALLFDSRKRRYLVTLQEGGEFHSHAGFIRHDSVIGQSEGIVVRTASDARYVVVRPTLDDFVLKMPRGAQIIYPKDLGQIVVQADIYPGVRVLEAGVGSGALSMTMVRLGADVVGYELREDFAQRAQANVESFAGSAAMSRFRVEVRDVYEGIDEADLDRIVLDLPEPWQVVAHAEKALHSGGIFLSYVPTILQVAELRKALDASNFDLAETTETLVRSWHVEGMSSAPRPSHGRTHGLFNTGAATQRMNELDWFLLGATIAAIAGGYQMGFFARTVSWIGLLGGLVLGVSVLPLLLPRLGHLDPVNRFVAAAVVLVVCGFVGQAIGLAIGAAVRRRLPEPVRVGDRVFGGVAGFIGVLVICWAMVPSMANVPGWPARAARNSLVARTLADSAPRPPDAVLAFERYLGVGRFPEVFSSGREAPVAGPPPGNLPFSEQEAQRLAASTVQIEAVGCGQVHQGSGFLIADGVVTNAHVISGTTKVSVRTIDNQVFPARVLRYEPDRDLALLRVPAFAAPPLVLDEAEGEELAAVFGHPNGQQQLRVAPTRVAEIINASGRDLYDRRDVERRVLVLAATLAVGDSGAAVVDAEGKVIGVTFALAPDRPATGYALDIRELNAMLAGRRVVDASTGNCLDG